MGDMVKVMDRIHELYQQYADGLIMEEECLGRIRAICDHRTSLILGELRSEIVALKRDVQEGSDLLEMVVGAKINDTIPAPPHECPVCSGVPDILFTSCDKCKRPSLIPPVTVGDEALGRWEGEGGCSLTVR